MARYVGEMVGEKEAGKEGKGEIEGGRLRRRKREREGGKQGTSEKEREGGKKEAD